MSEPNDKCLKEDKGLEEYLRRESVVSQRYRELDADEVPPQLDAAVLARARAAVSAPSKHKPDRMTSWRMTSWVKWGAPLALAASAVMVVAIVLEVGVQDQVHLPAPQVEQTRSTATAPSARAVEDFIEEAPRAPPPQEVSDAPAANAQPSSAEARDTRADSARNAEASRERKAETSRALAAPSPERAAAESVVVTGARPPGSAQNDSPSPVTMIAAPGLEEEIAAAIPPPDAIAPSSAREAEQLTTGRVEAQRTSAMARAQVPRLEPETWLERIRTLRREGKVIEADRQWREFREAYPQFEVSEADTARPTP